MNYKTLFSIAMFSVCLMAPKALHAQKQPDSQQKQPEPDKIAPEEDAFTDYFYEALKQKGIENYDKALEALQKCLSLKPDNAVIYNEMGRNYLALKKYDEAEKAFLKATQLEPDNRWYWSGLYDVYYETQDFNKSIPVVQKLMKWRKEYYEEDLVSLYMYTKQYDKALALIDELDQTVGHSDKREMYRLEIMNTDENRKPQKETLEAAIKANPKEESNYLKLIYLYSDSNEEEKAQQVAEQLAKEIPDSDWAQVSLFKFHLNNNEGDEAVKSMFRVLNSDKIDRKIKHRVLNEFLIFASNTPSYDKQLEQAVDIMSDDTIINVPKEVSKFFINKKQYANAELYIKKSLNAKPDDIEGAELLLTIYAESAQYAQLQKSAESYIDVYPTQASLYYYAGYAANGLKEYKKAKDWLDNGIDLVVENDELKAGFYKQLAEASQGLGDLKKKEDYLLKAAALQKPKADQ